MPSNRVVFLSLMENNIKLEVNSNRKKPIREIFSIKLNIEIAVN